MTITMGHILRIRNHELNFGKQTFIMGIVNVTPDSFSQDGLLDIGQATSSALEKVKQGAQIIDIGGQSTRPGYEAVSEQEEIARVIPVIKAIRQVSDVIISIDTFSAQVANEAVKSGADIINSIWGLTAELLDFIKAKPVPMVIMHNKLEAHYPMGVLEEVKRCLVDYAEQASAAGLSTEQIILDPGIGFGKTAEDNLEVLSHFSEIAALGFPTLIGTSRKSTIGKLTDRPVEGRVFGTAATVAYAIAQGVDIVRVHDVQEIADVIKISDALVRRWRPSDWK
jgi:dihydropteroate synthase